MDKKKKVKEFNQKRTEKIQNKKASSGAKKNLLKPKPESQSSKTVTGIIRINKNGTGFIDIQNSDSIIIPNKETNGAIDKDTVRVKILPKRTNPKFKNDRGQAGSVIKIIQRNTTQVSAIVEKVGELFYAKPLRSQYPFRILLQSKTDNLTQDLGIIATITSYESQEPGLILGEVSKILGKRGDHETDMQMILCDSLSCPEFSPDIEKEAKQYTEVNVTQELKNTYRKDFTNLTTFTIDPATAKDFDDALSVEILQNGDYKIGIHIADVSHYVKNGTALDSEAYRRGTSIYLVDRCIPMLPEFLSNGLCSLNEKVPRLVMSVIVTMDINSNIKDMWMGPGIIESNKRFTYEEVDEILTNKKGLLYKEIDILNNLSKTLHKARIKRGAFIFERDEIKFILDELGKPIGITKEKSSDSHLLVESFMLLANKIVADKMSTRNGGIGKKEGMYRIHEDPTESAMNELILFANLSGIPVPKSFKKPRDIMNYLISKAHGLPVENTMNEMIIRSQAKAVYDKENKGHFGLALASYCHFTSPIRRYPDLVVHRILKSMLTDEKFTKDKKDLTEIGYHTSDREVRAAEAERSSIRYKQIEFLENSVGTKRQGSIVRSTEFITKVLDIETGAIVECSNGVQDMAVGTSIEYTLTRADRLQDILTGEMVK